MDGNGLIQQGSKDYRRLNFALFLAGFVTFSTLYTFQPLFPGLVQEFAISPATASLTLSLATLALAWTLPISGSLSDALGRKRIMGIALILASLLTLASAAGHLLPVILTVRFFQGLVLAGVPAVAMAYLHEEIEPQACGKAMGIYIAGNALGGMTGRVLTALLGDFISWHWAVAVIGLAGLVMSVFFWFLVPPSRQFQRRPLRIGVLTKTLFGHLRNGRLLCLYLIAFTCMGGFVTLYNYVTFRLVGTEFGLSQSQAAAIFLAYTFGAFGSTLVGGVTHRFGRSSTILCCLATMVAGLSCTLSGHLVFVILGIVLFTVGFFGTHAVASAWVGALTTESRAQASSLYLFFYYLGSSLAGTIGGFVYSLQGWGGVVLMILALITFAGVVTLRLAHLVRGPESLWILSRPAVAKV